VGRRVERRESSGCRPLPATQLNQPVAITLVSHLTSHRPPPSAKQEEWRSTTMLGHLVGLVKVRVTRGVNLAIRDLRSSDPYVVVRMGKQVRSVSV
jgi:hypothetical protein